MLVSNGSVLISNHDYDELAEDDIFSDDALSGLPNAVVVEDYPNYAKGPCVLVLQHDSLGAAIHVVWGIPRGKTLPAVLITAYRADPELWENDLLTRRP